MEIIGKVKVVNPEQQISATFVKRELVITTEETYPQHILIEFIQDKVDLIDGLSPGDEVKVHFNISGRLWTNTAGEDKYFNSIKGWRVERLNQDNQQNSEQYTAPKPENAGDQFLNMDNKPQEFKPDYEPTDEEESDLPF